MLYGQYGKLCDTNYNFTMMVSWTWHRTSGRMEIMLDRLMEIKHVDEETISYHALFTFDVIE
jgi:hypothetical protein